ncbi:MAG: ATP-binding protein [Thalassotalea sp.]
MLRLFFSVYLALVAGLFVINQSSEWLWQKLTVAMPAADKNPLSQLEPLLYALPALIENDEQKRKIFEQKTGYSLAIISFDHIAWLTEQAQQLRTGKIVTTFDKNNDSHLFILAAGGADVYQLSVLANKQNQLVLSSPVISHQAVKYFVLTLSYLLLAAFIALLTWPLWRDIIQLRKMADDVEQGNLNISCKVNKHSPTKVVVESFQQMAQRITALLKEQSHLINAVSHELRTPLSRLRFTLAMAKEIPSQQLTDITTDIDEMEQLVDEILNYSRIENLQSELHYSVVNISELLVNLVEKHQRGTDKTIQLNIADQLLFNCDGHLLERACQNLISNAVRYGTSQIKVSANITNNQLLVVVADDGEGISPAQHAQLFLPFYKLDKSRSKNHESDRVEPDKSPNKTAGGFGLGLAIVKRIIDLHHGRCDISTSALGGAQFCLTLPKINNSA